MSNKQQRFCEEYVKDLCGGKAAIRAGYSAKSADTAASKLLAIKEIQVYVNFLQAEIAARNNITVDRWLKELADIGFSNVQDLLDNNMKIVNLKKLNPDKAKMIAGIQITESFTGTGKAKKRTVKTDVKLADKQNALMLIGKHLGFFEKDNKQKGIKFRISAAK